MPDKNLQTAIASALKMNVSQITKSDMMKLPAYLKLMYGKITNITGLEYGQNITKVDLQGNINIDEVSLKDTLSKMPNLYEVDIRDCYLQNLDWASSLTWLTALDVSNYANPSIGKLTSLEPIKDLTRLTFLNITGNQISDLSPLQSMSQLSTLWSATQKNLNGNNYTFSGTYTQPYILSKATVDAHNSTLYTGEAWTAQDNFDSATDKLGNPVAFNGVQVTGTVDTTQPGKYKVTYSYGGVQKEIEVTVLQKVSKENNNTSNSGEDKKNENPKTLSTNEKEKVLPSTGEKGSVWLFVSGVMLFIFASALALLRLKKSK